MIVSFRNEYERELCSTKKKKKRNKREMFKIILQYNWLIKVDIPNVHKYQVNLN